MQKGWALHEPRGKKNRFSENVRNYLTAKYNIGGRTKHKCNPWQVSTDMRKALAESGERLFDQSEWLTKTQVKVFFSRLTASRRKKQSQAQEKEMLESQVTDDSGEDDENEEEDEEEDEYDDVDSTEDDMHHEEIVQGILETSIPGKLLR